MQHFRFACLFKAKADVEESRKRGNLLFPSVPDPGFCCHKLKYLWQFDDRNALWWGWAPRAVEPSLVALHGIDTGNISERYFTSSFRL